MDKKTYLFLQRYKTLIFLLLAATVIVGLFTYHAVKKKNLRDEIVSQRETACDSYEEKLPDILKEKYPDITDVTVTASPYSTGHSYTDSRGKDSSYTLWTDTVRVKCHVGKSFNGLTDKNKLARMQDIYDTVRNSVKDIRKEVSPLYDEYYKKDEILYPFSTGIFAESDYWLDIDADGTVYEYYKYRYGEAGSYKENGKWVDPAEKKTAVTSSDTGKSDSISQNSGNSTTKKNSTYSYNDDEWPDCDDYEDEDDFLDDWDGEMPDGSDAEDYWDNW